MTKLSDKAREALKSAYATRGPHRGQLLARCPRSNTLEAAAWQAAMAVCNPYKMGIGTIMFFSGAQKEIYAPPLAHPPRQCDSLRAHAASRCHLGSLGGCWKGCRKSRRGAGRGFPAATAALHRRPALGLFCPEFGTNFPSASINSRTNDR
jgi:hypothetical protein